MANYTWSFNQIVPAFPESFSPNIALWSVTNGVDLNYEIQLSWPLDWTSQNATNVTALPMLDSNCGCSLPDQN